MVRFPNLALGLGSMMVAYGAAACTMAHGDNAGSDAGASDSTPPSDTDAAGDEFRAYNLAQVNQYRATQGIAPLVLDSALNGFAQEGSVQLTSDHTPHQHFEDAVAAKTLFTRGFKTMAAENQGDPNGWRVISADPATNEKMQIEDIQKRMFEEGPGTGSAHGHYENIMNSKYTRVGVGLVMVDGKLYLTNDFSD